MSSNLTIAWATLVVAGLFAAWPDAASARPFVELSGVVGIVADGRHTGWTEAVSWGPSLPPGQTCKDGWTNCLERNGHRITVLLRLNQLSATARAALGAGARFDEVRIEDYEGFGPGSDYSAMTLTLSDVRIDNVSVTGDGAQTADAVTLVFYKSSVQSSWDESDILSIRP